jgi:hypothetical protein
MIRWCCYTFLAFQLLTLQGIAQTQVILNPGFEQTAQFSAKPAYWKVGFSGSPAYYEDSLGEWGLDNSYFT